MTISVVMTVYNGEMYLLDQMESIQNQSVKANEVIICDDCSNDRSETIINEFIEKNKLRDSWKYIKNQTNLGYADNFHKGFSNAACDLIFFSDQDDVWNQDKLEVMSQIMEERPEILLLNSEFEPFYETEDAPVISQKTMNAMKDDSSVEKIPFQYSTIFIGSEGCTMCVRKTFLEKIEKHWFSGWAHDEFVWKMSLCLNGNYILHKKTIRRRMHSNNVSKRKMRDISKRIYFFELLLHGHNEMLNFATECHLENKSLKIIQKNIDSVVLRIDLMKNKKYFNTILLASRYFRCYHSRKSIPVELLMAFKSRKQ